MRVRVPKSLKVLSPHAQASGVPSSITARAGGFFCGGELITPVSLSSWNEPILTWLLRKPMPTPYDESGVRDGWKSALKTIPPAPVGPRQSSARSSSSFIDLTSGSTAGGAAFPLVFHVSKELRASLSCARITMTLAIGVSNKGAYDADLG